MIYLACLWLFILAIGIFVYWDIFGYWDSLIAQLVKNPFQCRRPRFNSWIGKICWRRGRLPTPVFLGFHCGSAGKESACNAGDLGLIRGLGRSPGGSSRGRLPTPVFWSGEFHGLYICGVAKSWRQLSNFHFTWLFWPSLLSPTRDNLRKVSEAWSIFWFLCVRHHVK